MDFLLQLFVWDFQKIPMSSMSSNRVVHDLNNMTVAIIFNEPGFWFAPPSSWPSGSPFLSPISFFLLLSDPVRKSHVKCRSRIKICELKLISCTMGSSWMQICTQKFHDVSKKVHFILLSPYNFWYRIPVESWFHYIRDF